MTTKTDLGRKVIRPYKKRPLDEISLEGTLYKYNYTSIPGAFKKLYPRTDAKGRIRTGLDENAIKFQAIRNKEDREAEMTRVKELREYYEGLLGESLTPDSDYWKTIKGDPDDPTNAGGFSLEDGENIFDMNDPHKAITYYWLMETGFIAPSITAIEEGQTDSFVAYYVHDEEEVTDVNFERLQKINNVRVTMSTLGDVRRKQIAKLLGLGISDTSSAKKVYVALDEYLATPKSYMDSDPVENFMRYAEMSEDLVKIKTLVQDLIKFNIVRLAGSVVKEGDYVWGKDIEEFESFLMAPSNSEYLDAFENKLRNKVRVEEI